MGFIESKIYEYWYVKILNNKMSVLMFKRCYFKELQNILGIFYYPVGAYLIHGCSSAFRN